MKILHVIAGLSTGGAETMLYKLLAGLDASKYQSSVVSLLDIGPVGHKIADLGVPVQAIAMSAGPSSLSAVCRLARLISETKPDLVQTWMYHADLIGGLAAKLAGGVPVVWNIRRSGVASGELRRRTLLIARVCALLSGLVPERIVSCSDAGRLAHQSLGYAADKFVVIPNGFQTDVFEPNYSYRCAVRLELGLPESALLVGIVGRFHPAKDYRSFVSAASLLAVRNPDVHFVLCGSGVTAENSSLWSWIQEGGYPDRFHLLGPRNDLPRIMAALDVLCSSSVTEGFPNVVGEAMACEIPCVVTDVGDSAFLVGNSGVVVPPARPTELATGLEEMLSVPLVRRSRGIAARTRVKEFFDMPAIVERYAALYEELGTRVRHSRVR